jgi:hypothetical protein
VRVGILKMYGLILNLVEVEESVDSNGTRKKNSTELCDFGIGQKRSEKPKHDQCTKIIHKW